MMSELALQDLRTSLRGQLFLPNQPGYEENRKVFNALIDRHPAMIVQCAGVADVITAVKFARAHNVEVAVRSTGHNVAGISVCDGGMVIDLSVMKGIHIDPEARTVRVEPGVTWAELNHELQFLALPPRAAMWGRRVWQGSRSGAGSAGWCASTAALWTICSPRTLSSPTVNFSLPARPQTLISFGAFAAEAEISVLSPLSNSKPTPPERCWPGSRCTRYPRRARQCASGAILKRQLPKRRATAP